MGPSSFVHAGAVITSTRVNYVLSCDFISYRGGGATPAPINQAEIHNQQSTHTKSFWRYLVLKTSSIEAVIPSTNLLCRRPCRDVVLAWARQTGIFPPPAPTGGVAHVRQEEGQEEVCVEPQEVDEVEPEHHPHRRTSARAGPHCACKPRRHQSGPLHVSASRLAAAVRSSCTRSHA